MKAILILAALFATWMAWPELSERFAQRVDSLPEFDIPTLKSNPAPEVTDPDIIYHGAHQWDPFTAPLGNDPAPSTGPSAKTNGQGDGGCNRILPNSGRCDSLQYHEGALHVPTNGVAGKDLL